METRLAPGGMPETTLAEAAKAYGNAANAVDALQKKREGIAAQLAVVDKEIAAATEKQEAAHTALRSRL